MNKFFRGIIVGGVAVVGAMLLLRTNNGSRLMERMGMAAEPLDHKARGAVKMVQDNARRWSAAIKDDTQNFTRRLTKRTTH